MNALNRLLSHDLPKNRWLAAALVLMMIALALAPFLFPDAMALSVAAMRLVFIVLVASFDLLLGYSGIGAYGIATASTRLGEGWLALAVGLAAALAVSLWVSLVIGQFSLRVKAIFYAMITLAVAAAFQTLASQLSDFTGGEDGLSFENPTLLSPSFEGLAEPRFGLTIDARIITHYLLFVAAVTLFLVMLRIVNSPFRRVLQAIRENDFRAEAIGFRSVVYRTLCGAVVGSVLFVLAQNYPLDLLKLAGSALEGVPMAGAAFTPDHWLLWLGVGFVLCVQFFPSGAVGWLRALGIRNEPAIGDPR